LYAQVALLKNGIFKYGIQEEKKLNIKPSILSLVWEASNACRFRSSAERTAVGS
jgi:hypothetical protein